MTVRSRREVVTFTRPVSIAGIGRTLAAGNYDVVIDEELIEGLSFASYRRLATMIMVPGAQPHQHSTEMIAISAADLSEARKQDAQ